MQLIDSLAGPMLNSHKKEKARLQPGGEQLADVRFDVVHTSGLIRAQRTAEIVMSKNRVSGEIPTKQDERLNERHYGDLQDSIKPNSRNSWSRTSPHLEALF